MTQVLGIDISKETFDVCLMVEGKTWQEKFENAPAGYKKLLRWVNKHGTEKVHACMEATGQYGDGLAEYLYQVGYTVSVVNPARIKAYAKSKMRRNKTDKADAELIALYCLREQPTAWSPPPASFKGLQALVRRLDDLQTTCQQEKNRLKSGGKQPDVIADTQEHIAYLEEHIKRILQAIHEHIQAYPELKQHLLVTVTELNTKEEVDHWAEALEKTLK